MARAIWRHAFQRDRDFITFRRPLTIGGKSFSPDEPFDKTLVPTRKLRQLFESHRIIFADVPKPGALPEKDESDDMLIGSNVLASTYEIAGKTVTLGDIVAAAHKLSGMTVEEWNALPEDDRDALIRLRLDGLLAQVPGDDVAEDEGIDGDGTTDLLDQEDEGAPINIPSDWATKPFLSIRALARKIDPTLPADVGKEDAFAAIELEIERQAANT